MRKHLLCTLPFVLALSVSALTACGGGNVPSTNVPNASAVVPVQSVRPDKKSDLIYVSDQGTGDVYVYTYPQGTLSQTLTGFASPEGLCSDKKGNVWVVDGYNEDIVEYAHGGSTPINTISEVNHNPQGCAIDPKNGDLAVANLANVSTAKATIAITNPKTKSSGWKFYADSAYESFWYCGYDDKGNLFASAYNGSVTGLSELPKGASTLTNLKTSQSLFGPGGVQWDGKYLAVGNEQSTIYQFSVSGGKATKQGSTSLGGAKGVYQFWIAGKDVFGADAGNSSVGVWKYPAGGSALKTITGFNTPLGITISRGK
ncbi:MAG TPA: hypothetical protein VKR56_11645 [Candidatus Cybelea sp.]|nr:hypothetical protein [Candidatus Cybelea sp.]